MKYLVSELISYMPEKPLNERQFLLEHLSHRARLGKSFLNWDYNLSQEDIKYLENEGLTVMRNNRIDSIIYPYTISWAECK